MASTAQHQLENSKEFWALDTPLDDISQKLFLLDAGFDEKSVESIFSFLKSNNLSVSVNRKTGKASLPRCQQIGLLNAVVYFSGIDFSMGELMAIDNNGWTAFKNRINLTFFKMRKKYGVEATNASALENAMLVTKKAIEKDKTFEILKNVNAPSKSTASKIVIDSVKSAEKNQEKEPVCEISGMEIVETLDQVFNRYISLLEDNNIIKKNDTLRIISIFNEKGLSSLEKTTSHDVKELALTSIIAISKKLGLKILSGDISTFIGMDDKVTWKIFPSVNALLSVEKVEETPRIKRKYVRKIKPEEKEEKIEPVKKNGLESIISDLVIGMKNAITSDVISAILPIIKAISPQAVEAAQKKERKLRFVYVDINHLQNYTYTVMGERFDTLHVIDGLHDALVNECGQFYPKDLVARVYCSPHLLKYREYISQKKEYLPGFADKFMNWNSIDVTKHVNGEKQYQDVDTYLVADGVEDIMKYGDEIKSIYITSGDKDMLPLVKLAKRKGINVYLVTFKTSIAKEMFKEINGFTSLGSAKFKE